MKAKASSERHEMEQLVSARVRLSTRSCSEVWPIRRELQSVVTPMARSWRPISSRTHRIYSRAIRRSGAYNRTLTPFGFQSEERTMWEAQETYNAMSPFMNAHKIKKPILLIHGEEDTNSGTTSCNRTFRRYQG